MHLRLLVLLLAIALVIAGCSVAVRLTETGISIEWPKPPTNILPF